MKDMMLTIVPSVGLGLKTSAKTRNVCFAQNVRQNHLFMKKNKGKQWEIN